jgi:hypothetical protein
MQAIKTLVTLLPLSLVLAGCAEQRLRQQADADDRLDTALAHVGPEVAMFRLQSDNASWEALGNQHLLVRDGDGHTWLLHTGVCPGLPNERYLTLTSSRDQFTYVGQDRVKRMSGSCDLLEARPVAGIDVQGVPGRLNMLTRPKQEDLAGSF